MESIDFDEASAAWRANKVRLKGGAFRYRCSYIKTTTGNNCRHKLYYDGYCKYHYYYFKQAGLTVSKN